MSRPPVQIEEYLGDGVYGQYDEPSTRGMIRLYTSDGINVGDEIFLEPEVARSLLGFMRRVDEARTAAARRDSAEYGQEWPEPLSFVSKE